MSYKISSFPNMWLKLTFRFSFQDQGQNNFVPWPFFFFNIVQIRQMLQVITDYKPKPRVATSTSASLLDEFNKFYACFEA